MNLLSGKKRLIQISLAVSIVLLAAKFFSYFLTHSNIILSDAMESIINVVASSFAAFSIYLSSQPKDENHPYGHGKIEFLASVTEGLLIFLAGLFIFVKACSNFFFEQTIQAMDIGLLIISATALVNFILGKILLREGKKTNSLLLIAEGKHLLSDNMTTLVGVAGIIVVVITNMPEIDTIFSLILGLIMLRSGYRIIRPSVAALMDEADSDLMKTVTEHFIKNRKDDWIDVHNMRIVKYGSDIHIDCHVTFPYYYSLTETHALVNDIELMLRKNYPQELEIFIHADPCIPADSCIICMKKYCTLRQKPFEKKIEWTPLMFSVNKKHHLQ
ncbi:cation transporter [Bacteroidota bacterium]|nr:cation transporter [Bacteroidota bacterium]